MEELYLTEEDREQAPLEALEDSLEEICSSMPPVFTIGVRTAPPIHGLPSPQRLV